MRNAWRVQKICIRRPDDSGGVPKAPYCIYRCSVSVDRRLHNRALADLDVELIRLNKQEQSIAGRLEDISEAGICLILPTELLTEELVRLEAADSTVFGHVVYSTWTRNAFRTGIELERVLLGATDLADLLRSALQETMPWASVSSR